MFPLAAVAVMLGLNVALLGLLLLALTILATHPTGALVQCRDAYERARSVTVEARR